MKEGNNNNAERRTGGEAMTVKMAYAVLVQDKLRQIDQLYKEMDIAYDAGFDDIAVFLNQIDSAVDELDELEPFGSVRYRTWEKLIERGYPDIAFDLKAEYRVQDRAREKGFTVDKSCLERLQAKASEISRQERYGIIIKGKHESQSSFRRRKERAERLLCDPNVASPPNSGFRPAREEQALRDPDVSPPRNSGSRVPRV